jgi:hypothetical protein
MPQSTICPYCNAKLRLSTSRRANKVKCRNCSSVFHPSQVTLHDATAVSLESPLTEAATPEAEPAVQPEPTRSTPATASAASERAETASVAAEVEAPESINPLVGAAAYPPELLSRRAARRDSARTRVKEMGANRRSMMSKYEVIFALTILAAGVGGTIYLGWYLLKPAPPRSAPPPVADTVTQGNSPRPTQMLDGELPRVLPKKLIGTWERRSDDETRGWVEYRDNNSLFARTWVGDEEVPSTKDSWFLVDEIGDDVIIDIGPERGSLKNARYYLTLTGNEAYTLTEIRKSGTRRLESIRFIRKAAPLLEPAQNVK